VIVLRPTRLHWIKDDGADDAKDLCAHSPVELRIDDAVLVRPEAGDWGVSVAAVLLLRTLTRSHTKDAPVGDNLFPHCGHVMYEIAGEPDVLLMDCPSGVDVEVVHCEDDHVRVGGQRVSKSDWSAAVCAFSDEVMAFYEASAPKEPFDDVDAAGFRMMMAEWRRRRGDM
jgi:hypothetical protein